jgi:hypothetical protein
MLRKTTCVRKDTQHYKSHPTLRTVICFEVMYVTKCNVKLQCQDNSIDTTLTRGEGTQPPSLPLSLSQVVL